jgi:capsular exopolysaccharide synthesis family protein
MVGLIIGLAVVGFIAAQDDRLTSFKELKLHFPEKVVGQIPDIQAGRASASLEPLIAQDRRHVFAESYRAMRSSLLFLSRSGKRAKSILITSAMPGEGKSTVTANLARTLAFAGSKVVLIDGDLRTGALHESLGLASGPGLAELRTHGGDRTALAVPTSVPNLYFIPRGTPSCDCGELFVCPELDQLLSELSQRFDYILIDSAPVFAAADTLSLAHKVDGAIFVIRDSFTRANLAREALNRLYQLEVRVFGIVLNRAASVIDDYYYSRNPERLSFPA